MSFEQNASPFGVGRTNQANEFAQRAARNLSSWVREHYEIYTLNQAAFTPSGLLNYHLRGDYYLGLTKNNADYENMGLFNAGNARLTNIASPVQSFDTGIARSIGLAERLGSQIPIAQPLGGGAQEFGIGNNSATVPPIAPEHFFTRDVARGSMLTEFLFAEQATLTYRLLPYMEDFQTGVRNFLVREAMHFIDNINRLRNQTGNNAGTTADIAMAFNLQGGPNSVYQDLDFFGILPNTIGTAGVINMPNPTPNIDISGYPDFAAIELDDAAPKLTFVLPIVYASSALNEFNAIVSPDLSPADTIQIRAILQDMLTQSVYYSYRIGGSYTIDPVPPGNFILGNTTSFRPFDRNGNLCSEKSENYNFNRTRNELRNFFDIYFDLVNTPFPVGTIVELAFPFAPPGSTFPQRPVNNQTQVPALNNADFALHMDGGRLFRITGMSTPRTFSNRPNIRRYQMESVDAVGIARGVTLENIQEVWRTDAGEVPGIILHRPAAQGVNDVSVHSPLNIIGRLFLTQSYHTFNTGAYYNANRDMRKLRASDAPGHYPPLNEAMQGGNANNPGRNGHQANHRFGVLDLYTEHRLDLIADYLAAMYDSLNGRYRENFVNFYTGDFHTNELDYLTNAVSNYIDSRVSPEDANREPVLVGPRLTTRLPEETIVSQIAVYPPNHPDVLAGLAVVGDRMPEQSHRQVMSFRTADPELVYYQIDSQLLRNILGQLNTQFYEWYVTMAEQLDRGTRNLIRAGNLDPDDPAQRALMVRSSGNNRDPAQDRTRIRPTKLILEAMWPLLSDRASKAIESGEVPKHTMMQTIAAAVTQHRGGTSQAIPAVPISASFIDFGKLLRSPTQYALPPELSTDDVIAFLDFLQSTYYNDYGLIALIASGIETVRTEQYSQGQLISAFKRQYNSFRNTRVLNRFTFPATASLVVAFRDMISTDPNARAIEAATATTETPPAPVEDPALAAPIPEPMRRG